MIVDMNAMYQMHCYNLPSSVQRVMFMNFKLRPQCYIWAFSLLLTGYVHEFQTSMLYLSILCSSTSYVYKFQTSNQQCYICWVYLVLISKYIKNLNLSQCIVFIFTYIKSCMYVVHAPSIEPTLEREHIFFIGI